MHTIDTAMNQDSDHRVDGPMRDAPTVRISGPADGRAFFRFWIDHRILDWAVGVAAGFAIRAWLVPLTHLQSIDPGVRITVFAAVGGGVFAFVAVAFTPLAILSALGPGRSVDRLRRFGGDLRRNFLSGTLVLLAGAAVIIGAGAADSSARASTAAITVACIAFSLVGVKVVRLIALFAAILSAVDRDELADRRRDLPKSA